MAREQKVQKPVTPTDLWGRKRIEGQRFWFLKPGRTSTCNEKMSSQLSLSSAGSSTAHTDRSSRESSRKGRNGERVEYVIERLFETSVVAQLSMTIESVEVILESEGTARTRGYPILAVNVSADTQVYEWTGDVSLLHFLAEQLVYDGRMAMILNARGFLPNMGIILTVFFWLVV